jgi:hypothetical protein
MVREVTRICAAACIALAGLAIYSATLRDTVEAAAVVEDSERDIGNVSLGEHTVTIRISNPTPQPIEVVQRQFT